MSTVGMVFQQTFLRSIQQFFIKNSGAHLPKIVDYNNVETLWVSICLPKSETHSQSIHKFRSPISDHCQSDIEIMQKKQRARGMQ